jgi:hypothetical protein
MSDYLPDVWKPSAPQRKLKAKLYSILVNNPMLRVESLTPGKIAALTGSVAVKSWMENPEFCSWLANKNHTKEMLDSGAEVAIERLIEIVQEREVGPSKAINAGAQVNAAKLLLEFSGLRPPSHRVVEYKDKDVADMDEAELRQYIEMEAPKMLKAPKGE